MTKHLFITFIVLVGLVFWGCSKEDSKTPQEYLIGSWQYSGLTISASGQTIDVFSSPLYSQDFACFKDDMMIFQTGNLGSMNFGSQKCDPTQPSDMPFVWKYQSPNLIITLGLSSDTLQVMQVDNTTLKVKQITYSDGAMSTPITIQATYTKK